MLLTFYILGCKKVIHASFYHIKEQVNYLVVVFLPVNTE